MRNANAIIWSLLSATCLCYKVDILNTIDSVSAREATSCMEKIIDTCFKYIDDYSQFSSHTNQSLLLTFMTSRDMEYPAEEIQDAIMQKVNLMMKWQVEVIERERFTFASYEYCVQRCGSKREVRRKKFVPKMKSYFYVIIADGEENVFAKLSAMSKLSTFNPKGTYLIFYTPKTRDSDLIAAAIYDKLDDLNIYRVYVLIWLQISHANINVYSVTLDYENKLCGKFKLTHVTFCTEGRIDAGIVAFNISQINDFKNCTQGVVSTTYEPFVIDKDSGFEMDVLNLIGETLNIHFNITIDDESNDWGLKTDSGFWNGSLGEIYNKSFIGLGNMGASYRYIEDFEFTTPYFMEDLVVAAPIAGYVPKWRVLTMIFTYEMWLIILGVIIISAVSIYLTAQIFKDLPNFRRLHIDLLVSLQLLLSQAMPKQPVSQPTRVAVLSMTIFAMITSAVYTSYMIKVLTNPIRETQIKTLEDIVSSGIPLGGLEIYKEIFNVTHDDISEALFSRYITDDDLDEAEDWLRVMSSHMNTCTVLSKFYTNFLIANKSQSVYDSDGHLKIFTFPQKMFSYYVSIVVRRGFPLISKFNLVINRLTVAGLQVKLASDYVASTKKVAAERDDQSDQTLELTIDHVQGAFAILAFGYLFSLVALVVERLVPWYNMKKSR